MSSQNFDSPTYTYILNADDGIADNANITGIAAQSGQFAFLDTGKSETGAIATGYDYYFATKSTGSVFRRSPSFNYSSVVNSVWSNSSTRTEQITYIGYNGTSGSLDAVNATYYSLGLVLNHTFGLLNNSPLMKTIPFKTTSATQYNLANGLAAAGNVSFARGVNKDVKFEVISNEAVDANYDITNDVTIVNGATTFSVLSNLTYNTAGGTMVVGDYIRFADDSLNGTLALVDPVYKITAINTLVVTVDRPIDIPAGTWNDAGDGSQVIPAATGATNDWGIRLTGASIADANFNPIVDTPFVVDFDVELSENFSTASVDYSTKPDIGFGTYQLVSYDEAFGLFNDKDKTISAYPVQPGHTFEAASGSAYTLVEFEASDSKFSSASTGINPISKFRIRIWYHDSDCSTDFGTAKTTMAGTQIQV